MTVDYNKATSKKFGRRTVLKVLGLGATSAAGLAAITDTAVAVHSDVPIWTDYTALELGANTLTTTDISAEWGDPRQISYVERTEITEKDGNHVSLDADNYGEPPQTHVFRFDITEQEAKQGSTGNVNSTGALEVTWTGAGSSIYGAWIDIFNVKQGSWEKVDETYEYGAVTLRGSVRSLGPYLDRPAGYVYIRAEK